MVLVPNMWLIFKNWNTFLLPCSSCPPSVATCCRACRTAAHAPPPSNPPPYLLLIGLLPPYSLPIGLLPPCSFPIGGQVPPRPRWAWTATNHSVSPVIRRGRGERYVGFKTFNRYKKDGHVITACGLDLHFYLSQTTSTLKQIYTKKQKNKNYRNNVVHALLCCARVKSAFVRGIDPQWGVSRKKDASVLPQYESKNGKRGFPPVQQI